MPLPRPFRTSTFRLTLAYAGIFAFSAVVLFGVVTWSATHFMAGQIDATVSNELAEIQADAAAPNAPGLEQIVAGLAMHSPGIVYLLQGPDGNVLAGNMLAIRPQPGLRVLASRHWPGSSRTADGLRGRGLVLPDGRYLFVGLGTFALGEMQEVIARAFAVGLGITLLLALAAGLVTSFGLLRRVEAVTAASREIMAGDLGRRIPLTGRNDEFDRLADSLNAMLARIEALMSELRQVTDDIAHDLRTPLARLRQGLELALRRETAIAGFQTALGNAIAHTDAILGTFSALLRIAQLEAGARRAAFEAVRLDALLNDLADAYRPEFDERGQILLTEITPTPAILGDASLLNQLFANFLENALIHVPRGATVRLALAPEEAAIIASVSDDGPGVPTEQRVKVLRRFYRLESSRTTPGNGLGLSLAAAIATLHGAHLALEDGRPGLRCSVSFPRTQFSEVLRRPG